MKYVSTAKGAREIDRKLIEDCKIPGIILMENAAFAVTEKVLQREGNVLVLCGCGNNGGDGLCIARQLNMHKRNVICAVIGNTEKIKGDALINYNAAVHSGCTVVNVNSISDLKNLFYENNIKITVDALFGTGLERDLQGLYAEVIGFVNAYDTYRIAADIPSGISADTGKVCGCAFRADETVTFQTAKRGHLLYPGREYTGILSVAPIGRELEMHEYFSEKCDIAKELPKRKADSHKGTYGRVLIVGGCNEYAGAAVMAAISAQRSGAGLVRVLTQKRAADTLLNIAPEIMTSCTESFSLHITDLQKHIDRCDCICVGMGMGQEYGNAELIKAFLMSGKKIVLDADALNCMARHRELLSLLHKSCVLTPHIGEFARLTEKSTEEINADYVGIAQDFVRKYHTNLHLKSSLSITVSETDVVWNTTGNSGLAKGGSGDTLSGLIASLAAQGKDVFSSAYVGAYIQGLAAESEELSERTVSATDISAAYAECFKMLDERRI